MEHLERFERSKGNRSAEQEIERNRDIERTEEDLVCNYEGCGKRCKSKGGLRIHQIRMHEESRGVFACDTCGRIFKTENTMINHRKTCTGSGERRRCERCGRKVERTNLARHRRTF